MLNSYGNLDTVVLPAMPLLAVKPVEGDGPMRTSDAPTAITDAPATLLDLAGLPNVYGRGESALALDPTTPRHRAYVHHTWNNADRRRAYYDVLHVFSVAGPVFEPRSWRFDRSIFEPTDDLCVQLRTHEAWLLAIEHGPDGPYRWSTFQAVVYVAPGTTQCSFEVRKAPAVASQRITVRIDGTIVDEFELSDDTWQSFVYHLRTDGRTDLFCVDLLVTPHWRDASNNALGAMFRGDVLAQ